MAIINQIDKLQGKRAEILATLQNITYDKVDTYIENNVVDLPSAKAFLKKLSKIVLYTIKEV